MSFLRVFVDNPLLTLFACMGVGLVLGKIRIAGISFGAAGALFAALGLSSLVYLADLPNLSGQVDAAGQELDRATVALPGFLTAFSLAVFCYTVGISAGPSIVAAFKTGWKPVIIASVSIVAMAGAAYGTGKAFGLRMGEIAGIYAGTGTATAALGVVQEQFKAAGSVEDVSGASVGYAIGYPIGVTATIVCIVAVIRLGQRFPLPEDTEVVSPMQVRTLLIGPDITGLTVAEAAQRYAFVVSRVTRDGSTATAEADRRLQPGDLVTVTGRTDDLERAADALGGFSSTEPWWDRSEIDYRRITLSNPDLATHTVDSLGLYDRFGAVISRVRRADVDLLATPDLKLQMGDRLRITAPRRIMRKVGDFIGDSERAAGDINPIGLGIGFSLGLLFGLLTIPLGGGSSLVIGSASGPLIIGTVLGAIGRTGPVVWLLPGTVTSTLNQFSLLLFLVAVGTGAGQSLVAAVQGGQWAAVAVVALITSLTHALCVVLGVRVLIRFGTARTLGALTGSQLNPGVYGFAFERMPDPRVALGYALLFPVIMVGKVLVDQLMVAFL
ncbi:MAG: aspartate:alanine exchanger family transporter [Actinomycetales bacterium]